MWLKNFSSQRMPCIPFDQVGTHWEASQEVGTASYVKLDSYMYIKTGFYLYRCKSTPLKLEYFFFPQRKAKTDLILPPASNFWQ